MRYVSHRAHIRAIGRSIRNAIHPSYRLVPMPQVDHPIIDLRITASNDIPPDVRAYIRLAAFNDHFWEIQSTSAVDPRAHWSVQLEELRRGREYLSGEMVAGRGMFASPADIARLKNNGIHPASYWYHITDSPEFVSRVTDTMVLSDGEVVNAGIKIEAIIPKGTMLKTNIRAPFPFTHFRPPLLPRLVHECYEHLHPTALVINSSEDPTLQDDSQNEEVHKMCQGEAENLFQLMLLGLEFSPDDEYRSVLSVYRAKESMGIRANQDMTTVE